MLEDKVREVILTPKKISSIIFLHGNARYKAEISPSRIVLSKKTPKTETPLAEYDIKNGVDSWYLDHVCGAKNFQNIGAVCYACSIEDSKLEATPDNIKIIAASSKYTPELSEILRHDIMTYVKKYESSVKNI